MLKSFKVFGSSKKGQTLIETVVTIGVVVVIVGSLMLLVIANARRSTLSKQAEQATKLVQEGLELVRAMRDANTPGQILVGSSSTDSCTTTPCAFSDLYHGAATNFVGCITDGKDALVETTEASCETPSNNASKRIFTLYTRSVSVISTVPSGPLCGDATLDGSEVKKIEVAVSWNSVIGTQERKATSCLTLFRKS